MESYGFESNRSEFPGEAFSLMTHTGGAVFHGTRTQYWQEAKKEKGELGSLLEKISSGSGHVSGTPAYSGSGDYDIKSLEDYRGRLFDFAKQAEGDDKKKLKASIKELDKKISKRKTLLSYKDGEGQVRIQGELEEMYSPADKNEKRPYEAFADNAEDMNRGMSHMRGAFNSFGGGAASAGGSYLGIQGLSGDFQMQSGSYGPMSGFGSVGGFGGGGFGGGGFSYGFGGMGMGGGIDNRGRKDRKLSQMIMFLLAQIMMGNTDAITSAMIMVSRKSKETLIKSATAMIFAMQQYDKQQEQLTNKFQSMEYNPKKPNEFQHEAQNLNIQINGIASARQMLMNQMRDVMSMTEEIGNVEKSLLDITGQFRRNYSRFNV